MRKIILFFLLTLPLFAHPHTFIDVYPSITFKDGIAKKIHFMWKIDEMTSSMLIMDVDSNGDGKLSKKESEFIKKEYFSIFKDYNYYTFIKIKGKNIVFPKAKNFIATIENHQVCYSFDIEGYFVAKDIVLEFGDTDFYVAMQLKKKFVNVKGAKAIVSDVDGDFYYGYKLEFK